MASRLAMIQKRHTFSALLFAGVVGLAYWYRDELITSIKGIHITWVALGFICITANYFFRALRLNLLTEHRLIIWPKGVYCTAIHGFITYMLPLRSGDLSLPFLLKATSNIDLKEGATILYKARLLEVFTLGIWLVAAALFPSSALPPAIMITMLLSGFLMVLSPLLLKMFFRIRIIPSTRLQRLASILAQSSQIKPLEILITCGIWASIALSIWCVSLAIQLPISVVNIFFLIAVQLVMQLMPIQGFANSGNHETGWAGALLLMGYAAEPALKFALTSHAIILIYALLIGLIALILRVALIDRLKITDA